MASQQSHSETDILAEEALRVPGYDPELQYEPTEARRAVLKVDLFILPFIVLCFCFLQFDRTNIGNALTDTMRKDINVGNTQVNLAQTLFIVGFVITEIPFNMISKYVGPERFLPVTMGLWGLTTWCQIFIKNASGLCAARFFIGALEGGYIPVRPIWASCRSTTNEFCRVLRFTSRNTIPTKSWPCASPSFGHRTASLAPWADLYRLDCYLFEETMDYMDGSGSSWWKAF